MESKEQKPEKAKLDCPECGGQNIKEFYDTARVWRTALKGKCIDCGNGWSLGL